MGTVYLTADQYRPYYWLFHIAIFWAVALAIVRVLDIYVVPNVNWNSLLKRKKWDGQS
jgi:hypothetical protein